MVASLRRSVGMETQEYESSTVRVWAAGFHHVTARSRLARVLKHMNRFISLIFPTSFRAAVNRGYGGPPVFQLPAISNNMAVAQTCEVQAKFAPLNL